MSQSPPSAEPLEITDDELSWMENSDNHVFITPSQVSRLVAEVRDVRAKNEHLVEDLDAMRDERNAAWDELEGLNQIHELCWEGEP